MNSVEAVFGRSPWHLKSVSRIIEITGGLQTNRNMLNKKHDLPPKYLSEVRKRKDNHHYEASNYFD
jgi:uncharacterized membrane protein